MKEYCIVSTLGRKDKRKRTLNRTTPDAGEGRTPHVRSEHHVHKNYGKHVPREGIYKPPVFIKNLRRDRSLRPLTIQGYSI
jgi:hypothetical protein